MAVEIEVYGGPLEQALMKGLALDERHEVLPDGEWIRAVRRATGLEELFLYFHRETGKFVVAGWTVPPWEVSGCGGVCQELETMDLPPDRGGWLALAYMQARCAPFTEHLEKMKMHISEARYHRRRLKASSLEQRKDAVRYLKRRGMDEAAASVAQSPYAGDEAGGDALGDIKESLKRMRRLS